ncbi:MAG TPA: Ig-like domain repeat protein [Candidatus Acidoferrum sp.]|nr:Ig-like domain repeat protein [Candidatus Acidoferrum sp.]
MSLHKNLRVGLVFSAAFLAHPPAALRAQATHPVASRIGAIDESSLVVLRGNRHPLATPANDRGEVASDLPMDRMLLVLARDAAAESALQSLLVRQQDKSSPDFHAWLSPAQFGERFGASQADRQKLTGWLESHGFRVNHVGRGGVIIEFSGTAGQVKDAFHTSIHSYVVNGEKHYANASDPQIPAALASIVAGIDTLHNFRKKPTIRVLGKASRIVNTSTWQPEFTFNGAAGVQHYLAPGDFATIYNTATLYQNGINGSGESVAIVARSNINLSDVQIFRIAFGLPVNDPQIILDGPDPGNLLGDEETEADLDVEWSGAIAPMATIKFVVSASTNSTDGVDLSSLYIVDNNLAPVLSASFGQCEQTLGQTENTFFNNLWEQAAAQGITAVISSGDNGPAGCDSADQTTPATQGLAVNGLASTPFNVAVGGTQFNENGADSTYWSATNAPNQSSALGYIPEVVWNESCADPNVCGVASLFASSGGVSTLYSKPSWQAGLGVPNDGKRDLPDVSLDAAAGHDGYLLCQDGICTTNASGQLINAELVGGTSAAAPTFAAILALIAQKTNSRQGQANFVLYPLAAAQNAANCNSTSPPQSQCTFNDITVGNNNVPGQTGFPATVGYDLATGWGSVNAANLAGNWQNVTFLSTVTKLQLSSTNLTHGQPVTATASVAPAVGAGTPTGDVALLAGGSAGVNLGNLSNGTVSGAVETLPGGTYSVTASYGGDGKYGASISAGVPITISPEASSTAFSAFLSGQAGPLSSQVSTTYGNILELQVSVAGASQQGTPTGTLTFSDTFNGNTSTLLTSSLNSQGNALIQETQLALGTHTLNVGYSGDASFSASGAGPISVTVAKGPTQTILFIPAGALPDSSVVLQAIVLPNGALEPTGTVQFFTGKTALGIPVQVKSLIATLTTTQLQAGSNSITAVYSGDPNFLGSTSAAATLTVGNPDFQISVNPGNVTISGPGPGSANILLTPGPGVGFVGPVSLSCSALPTGSTCTFLPVQPNLNGSTTSTVALSITKPPVQSSAMRMALHSGAQSLMGSLAGATLACAFLLAWPRKKHPCRIYALFLLGSLPCAMSGCSGGMGVSTAPGGPSATSFAVTVTASGGAGAQAVSHSVTLAVTVQ